MINTLLQLHEHGQSYWIDDLVRSMLKTGGWAMPTSGSAAAAVGSLAPVRRLGIRDDALRQRTGAAGALWHSP